MRQSPQPTDGDTPKGKMILAALDLLRRSGLAGAGINQVVDASQAPKGSLYHYFPGGKHELVATALSEAERSLGEGFTGIFGQSIPIGQKVRALFSKTGARLEASEFTKGCPVAAVTLDLDADCEVLRPACQRVFDTWVGCIAAGLKEVPDAERRPVAQLILGTLEGALILSRAHGRRDPLLHNGAQLADLLELKYSRPPRRRAPTRRP